MLQKLLLVKEMQLKNCLSIWHNFEAIYLSGRNKSTLLPPTSRGFELKSGPQQGVAPGTEQDMAIGHLPFAIDQDQDQYEDQVEAHAQRVLCILMPPRHRHLELLDSRPETQNPATGTELKLVPQSEPKSVDRCLCWCYFHCKQMMRNTQTHSDTGNL